MLNVVGQCGPLLGTRVFPKSQGPRYIEGQSICAAFMFFNAFLALSLRTLLVWENKRLDRRYGSTRSTKMRDTMRTTKDDNADTSVGEENYGRSFRYSKYHSYPKDCSPILGGSHRFCLGRKWPRLTKIDSTLMDILRLLKICPRIQMSRHAFP